MKRIKIFIVSEIDPVKAFGTIMEIMEVFEKSESKNLIEHELIFPL